MFRTANAPSDGFNADAGLFIWGFSAFKHGGPVTRPETGIHQPRAGQMVRRTLSLFRMYNVSNWVRLSLTVCVGGGSRAKIENIDRGNSVATEKRFVVDADVVSSGLFTCGGTGSSWPFDIPTYAAPLREGNPTSRHRHAASILDKAIKNENSGQRSASAPIPMLVQESNYLIETRSGGTVPRRGDHVQAPR